MGTATVDCHKCEKQIEVDTKYFQVFGEEPFCRDCLVHTRCHKCNSGLRLRPSDYQELGGDPVACSSCTDGQSSSDASISQNQSKPSSNNSTAQTQSKSSSSGAGTFWSGLTIGEKIVFPLAVIAFVVILSFMILVEVGGGEAQGPVLGLLIIIVWIYRRGKKNR